MKNICTKTMQKYITLLMIFSVFVNMTSAQMSKSAKVTSNVKNEKCDDERIKPEPNDWFAGDIHGHRSCDGSTPIPTSELPEMMKVNDLAVITVLADMGENYSTDRVEDLQKVNGNDSPLSAPDKIIHYGAEWHWDANWWTAQHQALGGHLVLLGLTEAHKIWDELSYNILEWAKKQNAVCGFAHMEYLNDSIQNRLNCCIPIDYPVEAALGTIDFISEDVYSINSSNNGNYNSEAVLNAYYKLLNCGFRLSLAAGTDYPCNNFEPYGSLLTYVEIPDKKLTYQKWIDGIAKGRTVISRNAHNEFLDLKVNKTEVPGADIRIKDKGEIMIQASWSVTKETLGQVELVSNGRVIAKKTGIAKPGKPLIISAKQLFSKSSWICARRMDSTGSGYVHVLHTSPVYIRVNDHAIRASRKDAQFFVAWIDNILKNIEPGGLWNRYFPNELEEAKEHYQKARDIYIKISSECQNN